MIFKHKGLLTLVSLSLIFMCCFFSVRAEQTAVHNAENSMDIDYVVETTEKNTSIRFGQISKALQTNYSDCGPLGANLPDLISGICKKYRANIVTFDDVQYVYNESTATLTVTGYEGSIYATAQNFVVEGLKLTNTDELNAQYGEQLARDVEASHFEAVRQGYTSSNDPKYERTVNRKFAELTEKRNQDPSKVDLRIKPLETVIIRGNIVKIGSDFCNAHPGCNRTGVLKHFRIKTVDMSESNVREIYDGAFLDCLELVNIVYPQNKAVPAMCMGAFAGCPNEASLRFSLADSTSQYKPVNYIYNPCCILL